MQIPHRVHREVPEENLVWTNPRGELGPVFRELARQKESEIIEGHLMPDHVHMLISIPPKYSVAQVMGI
jgi:putative transposase